MIWILKHADSSLYLFDIGPVVIYHCVSIPLSITPSSFLLLFIRINHVDALIDLSTSSVTRVGRSVMSMFGCAKFLDYRNGLIFVTLLELLVDINSKVLTVEVRLKVLVLIVLH